MKHHVIIACIGILIVSLAGCAEPKPPVANKVPDANESNTIGEPTAVLTRTPFPPNVRKDADGNLIKADGWPIQQIIPKETRRRTETGKTKKGRTVIYNVLLITPEGRPVAEAAVPYSENGAFENFYEWRVFYVRELSGSDGKVFCYEYGASLFTRNGNGNHNSGVATATSYRLCDYDGDGKYEYNGQNATVAIPNWVKSLPGDPSTVESNANY